MFEDEVAITCPCLRDLEYVGTGGIIWHTEADLSPLASGERVPVWGRGAIALACTR